MQYNYISNTDIKVSPVCFGTMNFGTPVAEVEAVKLVHEAIDRGINFIDTANMYEGYTRYSGSPGGTAEIILGKALASRRDKIILATKVGMKVGRNPEDEGLSPPAVEAQLEKSLRRLQTDYIDIYYLHKPDPDTPIQDTLKTVNKMIQSGKVLHYGISNFNAAETSNLLGVCDSYGLPRPVVHQLPFSLLKPDVEKDLLPLLEKEQIAAVPYQILQGGILTGKYKRGKPYPEGSRKAEKPGWVIELTEEVFDKLEKLEKDALRKKMTLLEYTLKETLLKPAVVSMVIGIKRVDQLKEIISLYS